MRNILDYFTSKTEIKPQPVQRRMADLEDYFTSKTEIKPQPNPSGTVKYPIILHQRLKSNHNHELHQ